MKRLLLLFLLNPIFQHLASAQESFTFIQIEDGILEFLQSEDDEGITKFQKFIEDEVLVNNLSFLRHLRAELGEYSNGLGVESTPTGLSFFLMGQGEGKQLNVSIAGGKIIDLQMAATVPGNSITIANIGAVFDSLEAVGYAGLISVIKNGEPIIVRPFGMANKTLEIPNSIDTIFGVGSRPIDFTIAAIILLHQQGQLNLDASINTVYPHIPADKAAITFRHLMNGQSGLPDFFHTDEDWNPDLAWISREVAVQRLFDSDLLFKPGTDQRHSHAAYGLLAAIVEQLSGVEFYDYLRQHFFDRAEMNRTGEYGELRGLNYSDFAEGGGPELVGSPNIPPNWGPTSWLVKGSGGMYSTLGDLQKFYQLIRSGEVLKADNNRNFWSTSVNLDGSMRGFELFSISAPAEQNEVYLFLNNIPDRQGVRQVFTALESLIF